MKAEPRPPTDFELTSLIHRMWDDGLNLELSNIAACMASRLKLRRTDKWTEELHRQLKRLVREDKLRRQNFLPGRPFYTIS